jgi:hypothetical protein
MHKASLGSFCLAAALELALACGPPGCAEPALGSSSEPVPVEAARAASPLGCVSSLERVLDRLDLSPGAAYADREGVQSGDRLGRSPDGEVTGGAATAAPFRAAPLLGA